jgi:hypothetical protein
MALTTTNAPSSDQANTQDPQSAPSATSSFGASQTSGGVQPGTAESLLSSQNGITLSSTSLPGVNLSTVSASQSTATNPSAQAKHHVSAPLLIFAVLLIAAAGVMFWATSRSVKNTT